MASPKVKAEYRNMQQEAAHWMMVLLDRLVEMCVQLLRNHEF